MTKSSLYKLIDLRARNSLGREVDLFSEFFPPTINGKDAFKYHLDHTRYTPRNPIQLMNRIQAASYSSYLTEQTVREGVNSYSENYFLMEVKDSMVGMLDDEDIEASFQAIRRSESPSSGSMSSELRSPILPGLSQCSMRSMSPGL